MKHDQMATYWRNTIGREMVKASAPLRQTAPGPGWGLTAGVILALITILTFGSH